MINNFKQYGTDIESNVIDQMTNACNLPITVAGALMPDAHLGYGLPIGGVLATKNAVIPFAVGMDIACRMKLSVFDLPTKMIVDDTDRLVKVLKKETAFGVGGRFQHHRDHEIMDADWNVTEITKQNKNKAFNQLGSSGSGNHFVEYGLLNVSNNEIGIPCGEYLALLTHGGSRGAGYAVASYYSKIAQEINENIPKEFHDLAWLSLDSKEGDDYWKAMNLMGDYAAANHHLIHKHIAESLGTEVIVSIENHHNFAWKENHSGEDVIVHRKGATPAHKGVLGVIPGSMATPGFVVRGKGNINSINSASHGAGRLMSRKAARTKFNWEQAREFLNKRNVHLISAGLDEVPMAYKDINQVMASQTDLVEVMARFDPRIVKMDK